MAQNIIYATNLNLLQGISISRGGPKLSHIFFADDSLFFLRATKENYQNIMKVFFITIVQHLGSESTKTSLPFSLVPTHSKM